MWAHRVQGRCDSSAHYMRGRETLESARHFGFLAYRKLVSTERRAFVILLQRPVSVVLRILRLSALKGTSPLTLRSIGVGIWEGMGRSASTGQRGGEVEQ